MTSLDSDREDPYTPAKPDAGAKRTTVIRVPMSAAEAQAIREKAADMGIPVARLIRLAMFGINHEASYQISPNTTKAPTVIMPRGRR